MANAASFVRALFSGSRFIRWALTPILLPFSIFMPMAVDRWTAMSVLEMVLLEAICVTVLISIWANDQVRLRGKRAAAGLVFLAYLIHFVDTAFLTDWRSHISGQNEESSTFYSPLGFLLIGLPCLWYSVFGGFRLPTTSQESKSDSEGEGLGQNKSRTSI